MIFSKVTIYFFFDKFFFYYFCAGTIHINHDYEEMFR